MKSEQKIIFVYNTESSLFAQLTDFVHKIVSPETYECNLCSLTYGKMAMKQEWRRFLSDIACPLEFIHRNEFIKRYPHLLSTALPAILSERSGEMYEIANAVELNQQQTLDELKALLRRKFSLWRVACA